MISTAAKRPGFHTSIGAATVGVLLAIGIRNLIGDLTSPLVAGLFRAANSLIRWQHLQMFPVAEPQFLWSIQIFHIAGALIFLVVAVRIAFWLAKHRPDSNSDNSTR